MQEYDVALKLLLQSPARYTIAATTGSVVAEWLDVELPKLQNLRLDLLGATGEGELIHLELQSTNDSRMALRMAEYCLGVYRVYGRFPRQVLLYVGEAALRMPTILRGGRLEFSYEAIDIRSIDGDRLLESEELGDNVIAILAHLSDYGDAVRKIMTRLAELEPTKRATALAQLLILSGLRGLEETVEREARTMPVFIDILENKVLGREFQKGKQEGREEGREEGRQEGELKILRQQIEKRFGPLPSWAEQRLIAASSEQLEQLATRVLDASGLEELFRPPPA